MKRVILCAVAILSMFIGGCEKEVVYDTYPKRILGKWQSVRREVSQSDGKQNVEVLSDVYYLFTEDKQVVMVDGADRYTGTYSIDKAVLKLILSHKLENGQESVEVMTYHLTLYKKEQMTLVREYKSTSSTPPFAEISVRDGTIFKLVDK